MADPCPCDQLLNIFCLDFRAAINDLYQEGPTCTLVNKIIGYQSVFLGVSQAIPPTQQLGFCDKHMRTFAGQLTAMGKRFQGAFDAGVGVTIATTAQFGEPIVNCPPTPPGKKMWSVREQWDILGPDLEAANTIVNNCCKGGDGMAVDEEARACCASAKDDIAKLEERIALLELQMEGAQILATEQAGRITRLQLFLEPVGRFGGQGDHFDLWLRNRAINDTAVQVALLVGMEIALREGGVATRQILVSVIVDALGKWFLDVIKAAIASMPGSVSVDPEGDQVPSTPQFITILDFVGLKSAQIGSADVAQASLDGGSSKTTGGSIAYGPSVAATGQGIGGLLASFGTGLADGLARGLKAGDITPSEEAKEEEDPIWAIMRRSIFGTAEQPPLTREELADIVSGSTTIKETPPAEEGQPPQPGGPPAEEGQPPQPGEPLPATPPAEEGQPPQGGA